MAIDTPETPEDDDLLAAKPTDAESGDDAETAIAADDNDEDPFATPSAVVQNDDGDPDDDPFGSPTADLFDEPSIDYPYGLANLKPQMRTGDDVTDFADIDIDELTKPIDLASVEDWTPKADQPDEGSQVDKINALETGEVQALRRTLRVHCFECLHWEDSSPNKNFASYETEMAAKDRLGSSLFNTPNNQGRNPASFPIAAQKYTCSRGEHLIAKFAEMVQIDSAFRKRRIDRTVLDKIATLLNDQICVQKDLPSENASPE